jgi:uncharacterized membrane protein YheB (UPF0754 family)
MSPELLRAILTIGFGSLAGGLTNTIAVWMLFHPYRPVKIGKVQLPFLHGAIPKNQDRLAAAVGRTVGGRLLTEDDLARIFAEPEFRAAFDARLAGFLASLLEQERGSLRELLPPEGISEVESFLDALADRMAERFEGWIASSEFDETLRRHLDDMIERLSDVPVAQLLTPEREEALVEATGHWLAGAVERDSFRETIDGYLDGAIHGMLQGERTVEEILPVGLAHALEHALSSFLPVAARRLGGVLEDPEARSRLELAIRELLQRFLRDLRFHQRVVARLVITDESIDKVLATLEEEGAERLSEMLRDPAVQEAIASRVNDGVVELLRRPATEVFGHPGDPGVQQGRTTLTDWILELARSPATRLYLARALEQGLGRIGQGTWGDLLHALPRERLADGVAGAARSTAARSLYRDALRRSMSALLDRPLGRPADWLPSGSPDRLREIFSPPLWRWLQGQVPEVVRTLDVGRRVEEKVRDYPVERMEDLVRRVTSRELRLIVRLGYVLGAIIGAVLVGVNALVG